MAKTKRLNQSRASYENHSTHHQTPQRLDQSASMSAIESGTEGVFIDPGPCSGPSTYSALGRPLPPEQVVMPWETAEALNKILVLFEEGLRTGRVIRLAGDGLAERKAYQTLSIAVSMQRNKGRTVRICAEPFISATPPAPAAAIAILPEAPVYATLGDDWERPAPGQLRILVGHEKDWGTIGAVPDFMFSSADPKEQEQDMRQHRHLLRVALLGQDRLLRLLVLLNGASVDVPATLTSRTTMPWLFAATGNGEGVENRWASVVAGQWVAREVVESIRRQQPSAIPAPGDLLPLADEPSLHPLLPAIHQRYSLVAGRLRR